MFEERFESKIDAHLAHPRSAPKQSPQIERGFTEAAKMYLTPVK